MQGLVALVLTEVCLVLNWNAESKLQAGIHSLMTLLGR